MMRLAGISPSKRAYAEEFIEHLCETYGVPLEDLLGKRRYASASRCRRVLMLILTDVWGIGATQVGSLLRCERTGVYHACDWLEELRTTDSELEEELTDAEEVANEYLRRYRGEIR